MKIIFPEGMNLNKFSIRKEIKKKSETFCDDDLVSLVIEKWDLIDRINTVLTRKTPVTGVIFFNFVIEKLRGKCEILFDFPYSDPGGLF